MVCLLQEKGKKDINNPTIIKNKQKKKKGKEKTPLNICVKLSGIIM